MASISSKTGWELGFGRLWQRHWQAAPPMRIVRVLRISRLKTLPVGPPFVSGFPAYAKKCIRSQVILRCVETPGFPFKIVIFHLRCALRSLYPEMCDEIR